MIAPFCQLCCFGKKNQMIVIHSLDCAYRNLLALLPIPVFFPRQSPFPYHSKSKLTRANTCVRMAQYFTVCDFLVWNRASLTRCTCRPLLTKTSSMGIGINWIWWTLTKPREGAYAEILFKVLGAIRGQKDGVRNLNFRQSRKINNTFMDMSVSSTAKTKLSHSLGGFDSKG